MVCRLCLCAWLALVHPWALGDGNTYRTPADDAASKLAVERASTECEKVDLRDVDRSKDRATLEAAIGKRNIILDALVKSNGTEEFGKNIQDELSVSFLVGLAGPMVFSFILAIVWSICCWTACPFCKCCRCCRKEHGKARIWAKVLAILILVGLLIGMIVCAFTSYKGRGQIADGLQSVSCTAARVVDYTLNGNVPLNFIGMLPLLDQMAKLRTILDDNSDFVNNVYSIVGKTEEIERATFLATEATKLLSATMSLPDNVNPAPPADTSKRNLHRCELCTQVSGPLDQVSNALATGIATALAAARDEVDQQLSPQSRASLRATFDSAVAPVRNASSTVRDSTQFFLQDQFVLIKNQGILVGSIAVISISVIVLLVTACGCTSGICCLLEEHSEEAEERGENPWTKTVPRCACTTWCCGWLYAFLVFFFGGFMVIFVVPMSSLCLIMEDLDSNLLKQVLPGLGVKMNTATDEFGMITDMIDTCFSLKSPPSDRSLMDIVSVVDNGNKTTLKHKLQSQTVDMIEAQFQQVDKKLGNSTPKLMQDSSLATLLQMLQTTSIDSTIVTQQALGNDVLYKGIAADPRNESAGVQAGFASSLACKDVSMNGATVTGLNGLTARLQGFTSLAKLPTVPPVSCPSPGAGKVVCNKDPSTGNAQSCSGISSVCAACTAANQLMDLKAQLVNNASYRCDIFQNAMGFDCDPKDMVKVGGVWTNDCVTKVNGDFSVKLKQKTCNLAQFNAYVSDWSSRLTQVFTRVDEAVPQVQANIATSLRDLVRKDVLDPVNIIISQAQCRFLKDSYGDLVKGLCYKGILGFSLVSKAYIANGILTVFLVLLMYIVWRRSNDNVESWDAKLRQVSVQ